MFIPKEHVICLLDIVFITYNTMQLLFIIFISISLDDSGLCLVLGVSVIFLQHPCLCTFFLSLPLVYHHFRWTGAKQSGMVVTEVNLLSGHKPVNMDKLKNEVNGLKQAEVSGKIMTLYFDEVSILFLHITDSYFLSLGLEYLQHYIYQGSLTLIVKLKTSIQNKYIILNLFN